MKELTLPRSKEELFKMIDRHLRVADRKELAFATSLSEYHFGLGIMGTSTLIRIILRYQKALFDILIKEKVIKLFGVNENFTNFAADYNHGNIS